jgi:thioredoxin-related protein
MSKFGRYTVRISLFSGVVVGVVLCLVVIRLSGFVLISQQALDEQALQIAKLSNENAELTHDLFIYKGPGVMFDISEQPYEDDGDASSKVASARQSAIDAQKFLMITFGANWCLDCRTLHHHLSSPEVRTFTADTFDFININVGKFNRNVELANELGIDLRRGIPVAVVFGPDGQVVGTTNEGQLEPYRYFTSKQILKFVRDIIERSLIAAPDSV